ncbi:LOW QUALITY PROTEIN: uncharacterized protein Dsimw501_GD27025 [Drosophila simulans]|uniref:Uncharacterized protein n=1 Tax=Drosophila simulans TaxID=7240 RepID=A0A0J9RI92_DROSI|nr:LOW QUALITY PROTEIN: uncharacterized protein Dsimw501_GD27025 [Drosophila simulans]
MCKRKLPIVWIHGGIACVTMMILLLRHGSTYAIIFLTPVVIVIGFASIIKLMSSIYVHFALLSIFVIPINSAFVFLLKINNLLKDWRSFEIYKILHLTFLLGKQLCFGNQISNVISVFMLLASVYFDLFK